MLRDHKHTETEKQGKKKMLDPDQPREDVAETGEGGKRPPESSPDLVKPGTGAQATGQTTRS
ncbi:MAG TPA: hypothetical protein VGK90_02490 [Rhizomicrobium sp.]|jgi:hypothetical protein